MPNKQQQQPPAPTPIRLGRVTIIGQDIQLDDDFQRDVIAAARSRAFAEHVLGGLIGLDDLHRASARAGAYLKTCLQAGDVAGVERWASAAMALDYLAEITGVDIEAHWPPTSSQVDVVPAAMTDEERDAELAAEAELEAERARLRGAT